SERDRRSRSRLRGRDRNSRTQATVSSGTGGRVVVVSPHLDDAILSLGATLARVSCDARSLDVVTVFCGDPTSTAPAGSWDSLAGFTPQGAASRQRRDEDRRACELVGATPRWLPFPDGQYPRLGRDDLGEVVSAACAGADTLLLPGFPLVHADHAELV